MLLTQQGGILKPFAIILGYIINAIFWILDKIGIPNIGLTIIIFTIVIYVLMIPLTYKQQKFSKFQARMNPELQAIRKKYEGKQDQESMMRMNSETQALYAKYGVSPSGSCLQLLIQMPILFALYRVIMTIPAYVGKVKEVFYPLVSNLVNTNGTDVFMRNLPGAAYYKKNFDNALFFALNSDTGRAFTENTFIDVLNRSSAAEWASVSEQYPMLADQVTNSYSLLSKYNYFLGLNIGESPKNVINTLLDAPKENILIILGVLLIPLFAGLTQWINTKLMPQMRDDNSNPNSQESAMASSLKTMNTVMPIMSIVFCYTLPIGLGLYWIAGSVVRSVIQVCLNKKIDKIDIDEMIKINIEKFNEKRQKLGLPPQQIVNNATLNTRNIKPEESEEAKLMKANQRAASLKESTEYYKNANADKPGSLAAKANMVKQYNEKNSNK